MIKHQGGATHGEMVFARQLPHAEPPLFRLGEYGIKGNARITMHSQQGSGKASEPRFTAKYVHIPHLREKLDRLYGHHPTVKTQYELARELDIAPSTLSTWLSGVRYGPNVAPVNPDSIPAKHFRRFKEVWGLPENVLRAEDLDEFCKALDTLEANRSPWDKLVRTLGDDSAVEIIANPTRGLRNPDAREEGGLLQFSVGDEIMLRIRNPGLAHGVMLLQDRAGWTSLFPSARAPTTEIADVMTFPRQSAAASPRFAEVESPTGVHRVLAIFTADPLPASVLDILLQEPIDAVSLNHTAAIFQHRIAAGPEKCRLLSRRFVVSEKAA
jgi:hypothetical protein